MNVVDKIMMEEALNRIERMTEPELAELLRGMAKKLGLHQLELLRRIISEEVNSR